MSEPSAMPPSYGEGIKRSTQTIRKEWKTSSLTTLRYDLAEYATENPEPHQQIEDLDLVSESALHRIARYFAKLTLE
jgi:hypothetical protein